MSDKLISLTQLQEYKTYADTKYQNKLTAGNNISINGTTISATGSPTFSTIGISGDVSVPNNTVTKVGEFTLQPGIYVLMFTCTFQGSSTTGCRQCAFSINDYDLEGLGDAYFDSQKPNGTVPAQTSVTAIFEVPSSSYPDGRKFYFLARQTSGSTLSAMPRAYYLKF